MPATTKIIEIGDDLGIILPEEMLARFELAVGDTIYLKEIPGGIELTARDEQMETARRVMRETTTS